MPPQAQFSGILRTLVGILQFQFSRFVPRRSDSPLWPPLRCALRSHPVPLAMSQLGTFLDTPIDEKSRKELLDAIKSARKNPPIRQERNLSSSGLAPMIVQKHLRKVDKAYKDNDYGTVIRIGAELARKGVDWDPALLARCSISFAVCMDGPLTCQFALASIQLNPEQAPAYIALAMLKSSARMFNDALILYDIGKTALNVPTSLCDELYPEIIWNQRISTSYRHPSPIAKFIFEFTAFLEF